MDLLLHDATKQKIGDIYQYVIALEACLSLKPGGKIYIEQYGDVTIIDDDGSIQIEVKSHASEHKLSNRHLDFWKTLKNWLSNPEIYRDYVAFILHTTSYVGVNSIFSGWDQLSAKERKVRILTEGSKRKEKEKAFREIYNQILEKEMHLEAVLTRIRIVDRQPKHKEILSRLKEHPGFLNVTESKKEALIDSLLGNLLGLVIKDPYSWTITHESFTSLFATTRDRHDERGSMLSDMFADQVPDKIDEGIYKQTFIKEILNIEYEKGVERAIIDRWKKNQTVNRYYVEDLRFTRDFKLYKSSLKDELEYDRELFVLDAHGKSHSDVIRDSQKFYISSMIKPEKMIGNTKNHGFFQRGTIHEIVDDGALVWFVGDEE